MGFNRLEEIESNDDCKTDGWERSGPRSDRLRSNEPLK